MKTETQVLKTNVWVQGILKSKGSVHYKTVLFLIFTLQCYLSTEDRKQAMSENERKKDQKKLTGGKTFRAEETLSLLFLSLFEFG